MSLRRTRDLTPHVLAKMIHTKPDNNDTNYEVLTKIEAAAFLGISPRSLDEWMKKGFMPFCKLPTGSVRFRRSQLIDALARFEVNSIHAQ